MYIVAAAMHCVERKMWCTGAKMAKMTKYLPLKYLNVCALVWMLILLHECIHVNYVTGRSPHETYCFDYVRMYVHMYVCPRFD